MTPLALAAWSLLACRPTADPPPAWLPEQVALTPELVAQAAQLRTATGLAGAGPDEACTAVSQALAAAPALQAHLADPPQSPEAVAALDEVLASLHLTSEPEVRATVDWLELSRAVGRNRTSTALVSVSGIAGHQPPWLRTGPPACTSLRALGPWVLRLAPSLRRAPECLSPLVLPALADGVGRAAAGTCFCEDAESARVEADRLAITLGNAGVLPADIGPAVVAAVAHPDARFTDACVKAP